MIYEQILAIVSDQPQGITVHGILAEARKQRMNKLTDIAVISRNIWALRENKGFVESKGTGKNRTYHITHAGSDHLAVKGIPQNIGATGATPSQKSIEELKTAIPETGTDEGNKTEQTDRIQNPSESDGKPIPIKYGAARRKSKQPPTDLPANDDLITDIKALLKNRLLIPAIAEKQAKITLLSTLADLCLDTETGRLLKAIKADLEALGHTDIL